MTEQSEMKETLITLTADIVAAHVSNNSVAVNDLPTLISNVHTALTGLDGPAPQPEAKQEPKERKDELECAHGALVPKRLSHLQRMSAMGRKQTFPAASTYPDWAEA